MLYPSIPSFISIGSLQILAQIQATAQMSQRNLAVAKAQIQQKEKDRRITQLTIAEIGELPRSDDIKLYKGVGKMWVSVN
jgi:prefoldin subunit 1